jgi:hypothetical protein
MESEPVREYCRLKGYADHVVQGGLERLVRGWEAAVSYLLAGKPQYLCEYLNDLDGRCILEESLAMAHPEQRQAVALRVQAADDLFLNATVLTEECLWGPENEQSHGWTAAAHWWYYRKPKNYEFPW